MLEFFKIDLYHSDIKPGNLVFLIETAEWKYIKFNVFKVKLKFIDFGFATNNFK